ncbi:hydroxymethylbilane synthase [Propionispira raffinosivorans]|uniref:hydroxymethylbilane synthase n=1 Tax=Propionispira raffinosivorans TaxID=86959 RepID=UPI0003750F33|nr:hydroxymethylbilane synthase [Propionispira raffinosivorans]
MKKNIIIGTRSSKLALWQAEHIAACLKKQYPGLTVELKHVMTTGDKILDTPLAKIGGKGLFTKELETEMLAGDIDFAVHSLKDMPTQIPDGLCLAVITKRFDSGDALVSPKYKTLQALPQGAKVGTSSLRRKAQLLHVRPDLNICDLRGNVNTRLKKLETENFAAIVLAAAGLKRLGLADLITDIILPEICLPAVGQGALAIEARAGDAAVLELLAFLNDAESVQNSTAERAFLAAVEGGCQVPVGVYAHIKENQLHVEAVIASVDGKRLLRDSITGAGVDADKLGFALAQRLLDAGGRQIMQELGLLL